MVSLVFCVSQTLEKTKGIEVLKEACAACGEAIAARKGRMLVKDEARVVSLWLFCSARHQLASGRLTQRVLLALLAC